VQELHRFPNGHVEELGRLYWVVLPLWAEVKAGLSLDTWGVDETACCVR
jgi:hypothetical protein